jgi:hypothetical protein
MRIFELFEQTIAPVPPGQGAPLPPTQPTTGAPANANTATGATLGNQQPVPGQAPAPNPNTPQVGQPMGGATNPQQAQQIQQGMNTTMTDLDKIAAQIVGLKQKQQQMQQQLKPV